MNAASAASERSAAKRELTPPNLVRTTLIGGVSVLNLLFSIAQQWYVLRTLGAGPETDALSASMVPLFLTAAFVSTPLMQVLVPVLAVESGEGFRVAAWTFLVAILGVFGLVSAILATTAGLWVPWFVPGFDVATVSLTVELVQIQAIGVMFTGVFVLLWSLQQARQHFVWVEVSGAIAGSLIFGLLVWGLPRFGVAFAAVCLALKPALQILFLIGELGAFRRPDWSLRALAEAWRRLRPLVLGTAYSKTDVIVERFLASLGPPGSMAILATAQQISAAAVRPLVSAFVAPVTPTLAEKSAAKDWPAFFALARNRTLLVVGVGVAIALVLFVGGTPALRIVFSSGRLVPGDISRLWVFVMVLACAFIAQIGTIVVLSSFYAMGNTFLPTVIMSVICTAGLLLRVGFFYAFGVIGIALAITLQAVANLCALSLALFHRERRKQRNRACASTPHTAAVPTA